MAEGLFVDVHYRGIELGRRLQFDAAAASGAYLHSPAPMPVGTILLLDHEVNAELTVRVTRVSEQVAGSERPAGMFVEPHELSEGAQARWKQWTDGSVESKATAPKDLDPSVTDVEGGVEEVEARDTDVMAAQPEHDAASADVPDDEPKSKSKPKKKRGRRKKAK